MNGIFLVNKKAGLTSHDIVYQIRKKFNIKKVGHTGTLDPFATGLLIILVGKATKLAFLFDELDKQYDGTIVLGKSYDTDDTTGEVINEVPVLFAEDDLKAILDKIVPTYRQIPPSYSAIKKAGVKAYEAARSGKPLDLPAREVSIYDFTYQIKEHTIDFSTHVSKGTYIRSIARDIGLGLNTFGALSVLNRTKIGLYSQNMSKTVEDIELPDLIDHTLLFEGVKKIVLNDYLIKLVKNGVVLDERQTNINEPFIVQDEVGTYIAYYVPDNQQYKLKYLF
ncbi:tRNA pseudouridine(55) synthase TruB [Acholeplasma laidlawii]|uniref:tRNA pseudouridine(55) synthase TruB n=1 Tax=Acholeplasma laidlawii TaxID=2148 RepID=UPI0018C2A1AE|nr:tRNA pseudouridine(55) synthase TruB [Acholeplasma laidlawii]MBG0762182.1 tRNA pseudouridine(55) synthase TruB [Acholeplasma laidlawii]